jgi:hypothetical protein
MQAQPKKLLSSLTATKALAIIVVVSSVLASISIIALGQLLGKPMESVMLLHGFFLMFAVMAGIGFVAVLAFGSGRTGQQQVLQQHHPDAVNVLKILVFTAVASTFIIEITGTIGYMEYRLPDPESAKSRVMEAFPFAHEPMFEIMEYLGLFGTVWTGLLAYLVWHFKEKMLTDSGTRSIMIALASLAVIYALVISLMGIVPTKIATIAQWQ